MHLTFKGIAPDSNAFHILSTEKEQWQRKVSLLFAFFDSLHSQTTKEKKVWRTEKKMKAFEVNTGVTSYWRSDLQGLKKHELHREQHNNTNK